MVFEGNILGVLDSLIEKKRLLALADPRHERIRPMLVVQGGALRGVSAAGHSVAFENHGLTDAFDASFTASTGSPVESYRLSGQVRLGRTIYWNECTTSAFLDFRRMFKNGHIMDIDFLCEVFRGNTGRKLCLDVAAMQQSRTEFFAAVTYAKTGEGAFIDMKKAIDPINVIRASIALPFVSHGNVEIEGEPYLDGAVAFPFPATEALRRFQPTDVLVLANCPRDEVPGAFEGRIASRIPGTISPGVKKAFDTQGARYSREISAFRKTTGLRWAIAWADKVIRPFEQNPGLLETASLQAEGLMNGLLAERKLSVCA